MKVGPYPERSYPALIVFIIASASASAKNNICVFLGDVCCHVFLVGFVHQFFFSFVS